MVSKFSFSVHANSQMLFCFDIEHPSNNNNTMQLNTGTVAGISGKDLNVEPAWMQGITGKGVVVTVFDDGMINNLHNPLRDTIILYLISPAGLQWTHPDIRPNYVRFPHKYLITQPPIHPLQKYYVQNQCFAVLPCINYNTVVNYIPHFLRPQCRLHHLRLCTVDLYTIFA